MAERGVWVAPWLGPKGETVLVAVDRHHCRIGDEVLVPAGMNSVLIADGLWERVDRDDPMPQLSVI